MNQLLLTVGDLVWDVLAQPDGLLLPGGDVAGQVALAPGGTAANSAVWLVRCGARAGFIGAIGADRLGDLALDDLTREGVEHHVVRSAARPTGVILVMVAPDGQRSFVTSRGADFTLRPEQLPEPLVASCRHLHLSAWSLFTDPPRAASVRAAQIARAAGATISLDPGSYQIIEQLGPDGFAAISAGIQVDFLFPNRDEARALTGETDPEAMAVSLLARYPGAMIVLKLDGDGCLVARGAERGFYPGIDVPVVDSTGAGDSFAGAFLASYLRDGDSAAAATLANQVGAWVVARSGARPESDAALLAILGQ